MKSFASARAKSLRLMSAKIADALELQMPPGQDPRGRNAMGQFAGADPAAGLDPMSAALAYGYPQRRRMDRVGLRRRPIGQTVVGRPEEVRS